MLWNEPQNHDVDCYFYNTTLIKGFNSKNKQQIVYADVPPVAKPVFIHVPKAENSLAVIENKPLDFEGDKPEPKRSKKNLILFDKAELNDSRGNLRKKFQMNSVKNISIFKKFVFYVFQRGPPSSFCRVIYSNSDQQHIFSTQQSNGYFIVKHGL